MEKAVLTALVLTCSLICSSAHAQCKADLFGKWENLQGGIVLHTPAFRGALFSPLLCTLRIEKLDLETWGSMYFTGKRTLALDTYSVRSLSDTTAKSYQNRKFEFAVRRSTSQELRLRPHNEEAIQLLGPETIEFFNQDYIKWDDLVLDKLYFSLPIGRFSVDLNSGLAYKEVERYKRKKWRYRYYTHLLDSNSLDSLRRHVLSSNIIYMSVCDRKWKMASDTMSKFIAIDYNDRVTHFSTHSVYDSMLPLYTDLIELGYNVKWKRTKEIAAAEREYDYFYHYGPK